MEEEKGDFISSYPQPQTLNYKELQLGEQIPSIESAEEVLIHCLGLKVRDDRSAYENNLPVLIVYQLLHLLQKAVDFIDEQQMPYLSEILTSKLLSSSAWLHKDLQVEPTEMVQEGAEDYVEETKLEDVALSDIGIFAKEKEVLVTQALQIIKSLCDRAPPSSELDYKKIVFGVIQQYEKGKETEGKDSQAKLEFAEKQE